MGNILLLTKIQELNQQGMYGVQLMLVQRYMLAAEGWLQNGLNDFDILVPEDVASSGVSFDWSLHSIFTFSFSKEQVNRVSRTHYSST